MGGAFLGNYLIGLREGLEATLVVTILVAFLVKSDRKHLLGQVWIGVGAALALSVGFGAVLTYVAEDLLDFEQKELFEAITSILAVVFVTWMIFWMRRFSRQLAKDLRGRLEQAIGIGAFAVVLMAFLAVAREGLETALLFYAAAQGATTSAGPLLGITLGVLTSVGLGWFLYAGAVRINLATFFRWTGVALVFIAAGLLSHAVHELIEIGVINIGTQTLFDISAILPHDEAGGSLLGQFLAALFGYTSTPEVTTFVVWLTYVVVVLSLYLRPVKRTPAPSSSPAPARS